MILAELTAHLTRRIQTGIAVGELPPEAARLTAHGTWRQAPPSTTPAPGTYATSLPFQLAALAGRPPHTSATYLAQALTDVPEISRTHAMNGYLTITITPATLASLPAKILAAGSAAACSDALAGQQLTAPSLPSLSETPTWDQAWWSQHRALLGRLGNAAGAQVKFSDAERMSSTSSPIWAGDSTPHSAIERFGLDAVRYALARTRSPSPDGIQDQLSRPLDLSNAFVLVRHAHADAASTLRWAADLGLASMSHGRADVVTALSPAELAVIDQLAWLPERLASAHRRRLPAEVTSYLENLAELWLDCSEQAPALPFRGNRAPGQDAAALRAARLVLASATSSTLAGGLELMAVTAPARV